MAQIVEGLTGFRMVYLVWPNSPLSATISPGPNLGSIMWSHNLREFYENQFLPDFLFFNYVMYQQPYLNIKGALSFFMFYLSINLYYLFAVLRKPRVSEGLEGNCASLDNAEIVFRLHYPRKHAIGKSTDYIDTLSLSQSFLGINYCLDEELIQYRYVHTSAFNK